MKRTLLAAGLFVSLILNAFAQEPPLNLWPAGKMPGHGAEQPECETPAPNGGVQQFTNVSTPTLTLYKAPGANSTHPAPAVIVCPGGGYHHLAYAKEGTEIAQWLNIIGITGAILKYRVPGNNEGAFQDIQRAMHLIRANAQAWGIDPSRVGIIGFSAGGHLCARLSTHFETAAYPAIDEADKTPCKPDFALLVYPAYLGKPDGQISKEVAVSPQTPPIFIAHSEDDHTFAAGSKAFHEALEAAHIPNRYCLWATGGHGYGLRCQKEAKAWPLEAQKWLAQRSIIQTPGTGK